MQWKLHAACFMLDMVSLTLGGAVTGQMELPLVHDSLHKAAISWCRPRPPAACCGAGAGPTVKPYQGLRGFAYGAGTADWLLRDGPGSPLQPGPLDFGRTPPAGLCGARGMC